jgi:DNA-binding MarR family transcriptional regulator
MMSLAPLMGVSWHRELPEDSMTKPKIAARKTKAPAKARAQPAKRAASLPDAKTKLQAAARKSPTTDSAKRVPVNQIIAQWQRERPDLDPTPMMLFGALAQAQLLTTPYINRVVARHGLTRGTFDVISALRRAGPPYALTPKQLTESLLISGPGMTGRLDKLEQLNLIVRLPEPNDRRSLKIQLTQRGVQLVDEIIPHFVAAQWHVVAELGSRDSATLIALLQRVAETLFAAIDPADLR